MNEALLHSLFEQARSTPYAMNAKPGDTAANCVQKNGKLAADLALHGFTVRGCVGEFDWAATPLPPAVVARAGYPFPTTHYWLEVYKKEGWRRLDASADDRLVRAGWPACTSTNGALMVSVQKVYTEAEHQAFLAQWHNPAVVQTYYAAAGPFLAAANTYFNGLR